MYIIVMFNIKGLIILNCKMQSANNQSFYTGLNVKLFSDWETQSRFLAYYRVCMLKPTSSHF